MECSSRRLTCRTGESLPKCLSKPDPPARRTSRMDSRSEADRTVVRVFWMDGMDGSCAPSWKDIFVYEQLAARSTGRQHGNGGRRHMERLFPSLLCLAVRGSFYIFLAAM